MFLNIILINYYDFRLDTVELNIISNHGHPDYTCLYRFRLEKILIIKFKTTDFIFFTGNYS